MAKFKLIKNIDGISNFIPIKLMRKPHSLRDVSYCSRRAGRFACRKFASAVLTFLLIFQTIAGLFLPARISISPPEIKVSQTLAAGEGWYDASWTRRKAITVTENSGSALTNYQVKITVPYDSDMQADFDDIRFTDENGSTLIDHWLESKTDSTTADFWVEIPSLAASSIKTIYLYYGNPSASSASNGTNTFEFFDDFSGGLGKWIIDQGGIATIENEALKIPGGSTLYYSILRSTTTFNPQNKAIESRTKISGESSSGEWFINYFTAENYKYCTKYSYSTTQAYDLSLYSFADGSWSERARVNGYNNIYPQGSWHRFSFKKDGGTVIKLTDVSNPSNELTTTHASLDDLTNTSIVFAQSGTITGSFYVDWIGVRNYTSTEPTYHFTGIEEKQSPSSLTNWTYRKQITIDHTKVSNTDQTNFPVLINLAADSNLASHAQADGDDILFTLNSVNWATGTENNKLAHEIEKYNSATGELVAWVKIPNLSASTDTVLYMYYGNASAINQQNTIAVWDSNFKMVQHLEESPANGVAGHFDSTSNANTGTPQNFNGTSTSTTNPELHDPSWETNKKIDGADVFDGVNDYINFGTDPSLSGTTDFTVSLWVNTTNDGATDEDGMTLIAMRNGGYNGEYIVNIGRNYDGGNPQPGKVMFIVYNSGFQWEIWSNLRVDDGNWHFLTLVRNGTNGYIFIDGVVDNSATGSIKSFNSSLVTTIGRDEHYDARYFEGILDEICLSVTARSADWILTEYNNQSSPSTFYTLGSEEYLDHLEITGAGTMTAGGSQAITVMYTDILHFFK